VTDGARILGLSIAGTNRTEITTRAGDLTTSIYKSLITLQLVMGAHNSVHPDVDDRDLVRDSNLAAMHCCCFGSKRSIAVFNKTKRMLYVAVADSRSVNSVREANIGVHAGLDGAGGNLHLALNLDRETNLSQIKLPAGQKRSFNILSEYGLVWVSDNASYPQARTPYFSFRVNAGQMLQILADAFDDETEGIEKQSGFNQLTIQQSRLLDVPGIGPSGQRKLVQAGCATPQELLDKFDSLGGDEAAMESWLISVGIYRNHARITSQALSTKLGRNQDAQRPFK
jgi:hypothetical protein